MHKVMFDNLSKAVTDFYTFTLAEITNIRTIRKPIIRQTTES